jgi:transposase
MANKEKAVEAPKQPVQIKVSEVLAMLNNGQDRRQIAKHYGVTLATIKEVFKHEKLKGARVKPRTPVDLVDDTVESTTEAAPAAAASTEQPASNTTQEVVAEAAPAASADKGVW